MSRSNPDQATRPKKSAGGLQARLLGQIAERQQNSAKGNEVWVDILEDRMSIGGYRLEAVLQSVEERLGSNAKILRTERQIIGGVKGFFGRECFVVETALPQVELSEVELSEVELPGSLDPEFGSEQVQHGDPEGPSFARALAKALAEVERVESSLQVDDAPEFRSGAAFLTLEAEGLTHEALAAQVSDLMGEVAAPPTSGIVAIVGDPDECVAAARSLAELHGVDPGEVLVMSPEPISGHPSWMCVTTIDDCVRRRARWSNDQRLHIVAVVLNAGPSGMEWACASLDALAPEQTHLAVPGWRRVEDVVARLRSLAPIAAIDLVGETDPATAIGFLDLDVPVSTIDGAEATVELWCSYLETSPTAVRPATSGRITAGPTTRNASEVNSLQLPAVPATRLEQVLLDQALTASTGVENLR